MAKFVDINSLTEKVNPDGNEQIQVSDTQKFVWKNALMNSGESIGAILSYATQYAMGKTTDRQTIISMLGQLFYNTGSRANSFFRFVCGSVRIPGGTPKQEYFGVVFYDAHYTRTYAVFFGFENGAVPVTFFQRSGNYVTDSPVDDNFVTNIINGTSWTKLGTLDFFGGTLLAQNVVVTTPTLYDENSAPTVFPQDQNNLQQLIQWILYTLGVRSDVNGLGRTMFIVHGNGNIGIITLDTQNTDKYYALIFGDGEYLHSYSIESTVVAEWVANNSSDVEILSSILENGTSMGSIPFDMSVFATKSYVKPNDGVLTMFPSGYRTVIPGENLTTNLTSGTLKIKVPDLLTAQVKNGPFRDAVIDVPYGVTVQFADQVGIVYKADGVDGFTATSGRKVYTIHFVPTTSSTTNITFRAFVNVTNYKTGKTVPKTLTYQFENSSGMGLSIVQGNPENPLTSRIVNVPFSNDPYVITSRLSSEGNITPMISVKSENNWVLNIRVYLRKYGTATDTFLGGLNVDKDHYGTNTISGTTKVNFGDTLIYRIGLLDGVLTSKSIAHTFPTGSIQDPFYGFSMEDLYTTSFIGMDLKRDEPYPYDLEVNLGPSTKSTFEDCNAVVEFYEKYNGKIGEITFKSDTEDNIGETLVGMDTNKKVVMYLKYVTSARVDPPTPSKVAIDFTVGISLRSPGTETTIFIYNKARTRLLKHVTYEDGDVIVGSSTKFTNVPNSDNNVYYLVITGSVNKSELFNFYNGGVYIF